MNSLRTQQPIPVRTLFLVGFMGCGKTTVGKLLAQRMAWKFVDLDLLMEEAEGKTIAEIFARAGEAAFRRREQELLRRILQETPQPGGRVVALGGGTFAQPANLELLQRAQAITIWLECPVEQLLMRCALMLNRPLFRDEASFRKLYEERLPYYQQATFTVHSGPGDPSEVVQQVLSLPVLQGAACLAGSEPQRCTPPSTAP
ncbi:MAG: shikimate kinase [Acidobacteria bacterium]|nr:shikimate kinase [Acidobacteriota bacterium]